MSSDALWAIKCGRHATANEEYPFWLHMLKCGRVRMPRGTHAHHNSERAAVVFAIWPTMRAERFELPTFWSGVRRATVAPYPQLIFYKNCSSIQIKWAGRVQSRMSTHHDVPPISRRIPDVACFSSPPIVGPTWGLAPMPTELVRVALRAPSPTCIRNCEIFVCQLQNVPDNRAPAHQPA